GTLMGGIDPVALTGAFAVLLGMAVLGCTLALTLSVWGRKTHEVLLATYLVWILWFLAAPIGWVLALALAGSGAPPSDLLWKFHPFLLTVGANDPRFSYSPGVAAQGLFLVLALVLSAGLAALTVVRLRPVIIGQWGRAEQSNAVGARPVGSWMHR